MKPSSKRTLGAAIIALSVLAIAIGVCQIIPLAFVDFPCFDEEFLQAEIKPDTQIAYCISLWPLRAISGGGIYEYGSTSQDDVTVHELELTRDGQTIFVNAHPLLTGETYKMTRWKMSFNPWVLFTRRFEIKNDRVVTSTEAVENVDALYVSGDVYEGWFINPLGLVIFGGGIWLFRRGNKELKQGSLTITKADYSRFR
jgi:hypothetical protein